MKKALLSLSCLAFLFVTAAGSEAGTPPQTKPAASKTTGATKDTFEKGKKLIAGSDCMACHKVDTKLVGPAYLDVAKKYPAKKENVDYLAGKIIKGGKGVWGQIPMAPHPGISAADAQEMAKYILSLNK